MATDVITEACVAGVRRGDRGAFDQLFTAWYARLADYALRLVDGRDAAEDVVQDVFVAVWNRRADLPDASKLAAYLHTSVRNRALNYLRDSRASRHVSLHLSLATDDGLSVEPTIDVQLADDELAEALHQALAALGPRTREIFLLSRQQELTYKEIAHVLEISPKTVETLMGRALKTLREGLRVRLLE